VGLFDFLRRRPTPVRQPCVVTFDDDAITCRRPGGLVETVRWSDLHSVVIHTTDEGPFVEDIFWVLAGSESGCVIPDDSDGIRPLLERLQQLPGFDNHALMEAMSSTDNADFLCWKH